MSVLPESGSHREQILNCLSQLHRFNREERDDAVSKLKQFEREKTIHILSELLHETDQDLRCDAAEALVRIDSDRTMSLLFPLLRDDDSTVRWNTCGLLHDFGDERAIPWLIDVLSDDPQGDIRLIAAYALGEIGDNSALPVLHRAVQLDDGIDSDGRTIRQAAEEAIQRITDRS